MAEAVADARKIEALIARWSGLPSGAGYKNFAYRWAKEWSDATLLPNEIFTRLVALNATRAAEEAARQIRWLRPEYQATWFGR